MAAFRVGEEVLFEGTRYVVASIETGLSGRLRLLATTPAGARFVWTTPERLQRIEAYTRSDDDTARHGRPR